MKLQGTGEAVLEGSMLVRAGKVATWSLPIHVYPFAGEKGERQFVSECLSLRLVSHGWTREEAESSIKNMIGEYLEELIEMGRLDAFLHEHGWVVAGQARPDEQAWVPPQIISTLASATAA